MDLQLTGKVALIFGGADGLGAAIVRSLHGEGASVAIADRHADRAESLAAELGERAVGLACDVSNKEQIRRAVAGTHEALGQLHIMVQTVGLTLPDKLDEIDENDIDTTFTLNMRSHLWAAQAAAPLMREAGYGRLVYLGSGSGMKGSAGMALYSASKFFLRGLTHATALELGPAGITANVVCPSDVYPEGDRPAGSWRNEKLVRITCEKEGVPDLAAIRDKRAGRTPVRRTCTVEDVADLVTYLASPRAGFITAQTIGVNGGLLPS